jgi:hypothetical protein
MKILASLFWAACVVAALALANGDEDAINGVVGAGAVAVIFTALAVIEGRP